jgi:hypothetical protein
VKQEHYSRFATNRKVGCDGKILFSCIQTCCKKCAVALPEKFTAQQTVHYIIFLVHRIRIKSGDRIIQLTVFIPSANTKLNTLLSGSL